MTGPTGAPRPRCADEGGSVLPLVALALVALMTCAALAIDIGSVAATNRRLQGVADLSAIAGSQELIGAACNYKYMLASDVAASSVFEHVRAAAVDRSAVRNSFPIGGAKTLVVDVGTIAFSGGTPTFTTIWSTANGTDCTSAAVPTAVRVTAGDFTSFGFGNVVGQRGRSTVRSGTALHKGDGGTLCTTTCGTPDSSPRGAFTIGSSVADLDSASSPILSSVLNGMVCGSLVPCSFSTSLVGYQGLAAATVTLGQLQAQLGLGSVTSLLNASVRAQDLYLATAKALGCSVAAGCSNAAAVTLLGLAGSVTSSGTFKFGDLITVVNGSDTAVASSTFNVLGLVTGSAQVINGTNTVSVPVTTVTIPGSLGTPTSTTLSIKVIETPQSYSGPVGGSRTTSQVVVTVSQKLNLLNIPLVGSLLGNLASVTGTLPIKVTAGSATGTLTRVDCGSPKGEVVSVDTTGSTTVIGDTNTANKFLNVNVAGLRVAGLNVNGTSSVAGVNGNQLTFSYPSGYLPANPNPTHVGGTTLNVQGTGISSSLDVVGLTLDATALTSALTGATGLVTTLDKAVISPVLRALGLDVGGADVWAFGAPGCGLPVIAG